MEDGESLEAGGGDVGAAGIDEEDVLSFGFEGGGEGAFEEAGAGDEAPWVRGLETPSLRAKGAAVRP